MKKRMITILLTGTMSAGLAAGSPVWVSADSTEDVKLTLIHDLNEENSISFVEQAVSLFEEENAGEQ